MLCLEASEQQKPKSRLHQVIEVKLISTNINEPSNYFIQPHYRNDSQDSHCDQPPQCVSCFLSHEGKQTMSGPPTHHPSLLTETHMEVDNGSLQEYSFINWQLQDRRTPLSCFLLASFASFCICELCLFDPSSLSLEPSKVKGNLTHHHISVLFQ